MGSGYWFFGIPQHQRRWHTKSDLWSLSTEVVSKLYSGVFGGGCGYLGSQWVPWAYQGQATESSCFFPTVSALDPVFRVWDHCMVLQMSSGCPCCGSMFPCRRRYLVSRCWETQQGGYFVYSRLVRVCHWCSCHWRIWGQWWQWGRGVTEFIFLLLVINQTLLVSWKYEHFWFIIWNIHLSDSFKHNTDLVALLSHKCFVINNLSIVTYYDLSENYIIIFFYIYTSRKF